MQEKRFENRALDNIEKATQRSLGMLVIHSEYRTENMLPIFNIKIICVSHGCDVTQVLNNV